VRKRNTNSDDRHKEEEKKIVKFITRTQRKQLSDEVTEDVGWVPQMVTTRLDEKKEHGKRERL
jgi:hypothetical protein